MNENAGAIAFAGIGRIADDIDGVHSKFRATAVAIFG